MTCYYKTSNGECVTRG